VKSWGKTAFFWGKALDLPGKNRYNDVIIKLISKQKRLFDYFLYRKAVFLFAIVIFP
jgi:hypothetical protein